MTDYTTKVNQIITENNIILLNPIELRLNRDTTIKYICIECDDEVTKSVRYFCKDYLCCKCIINNKPVSYEKSLEYLSPNVAKLWHPDKNKKTPKDYKCLSMKKVWWLCEKKSECGCLHEYEARIADMVKCNLSESKGCPFCTNMNSNKKFCVHKSLAGVHPELCKYWSKNNLNKPWEYLPRSEKEVLWNCDGCIHCGRKHEYLQKISTKTGKKENGEVRGNSDIGGCVICQPGTIYICECQQLKNIYPHLYVECYIEKNIEEDENFKIDAISLGSRLKLWWKCLNNSEHIWKTTVCNRTRLGSGCPYCCIRNKPYKLDELIEQLNNKHNNQYEYPYIEREYMNSTSAITILHKTCGNIHIVNVGHHKNSMVGCQVCNKGRRYSQMAINYLKFISILYDVEIKHAENGGEYKIKTTKYKADGYCEKTNTIYEFHGTEYHGHPILNYKSTDYNYLGKKYIELYQNTLNRENKIKELGYNLVTMWEHDWININKSIKVLQKKFKLNKRIKK
jgi:hypothetical protein